MINKSACVSQYIHRNTAASFDMIINLSSNLSLDKPPELIEKIEIRKALRLFFKHRMCTHNLNGDTFVVVTALQKFDT